LVAGAGTYNVSGGFVTSGTDITWRYEVSPVDATIPARIATVRPHGSWMSNIYVGGGSTGTFGPQNSTGQSTGEYKLAADSDTTPFPGVTLATVTWDGDSFGSATVDKLPWSYTNNQSYEVLVEVVDSATLETTIDFVTV